MYGAILGPWKEVPFFSSLSPNLLQAVTLPPPACFFIAIISAGSKCVWLFDLSHKWLAWSGKPHGLSSPVCSVASAHFIVLFQIMTGNSILKDGRSVVEVYGIDLDKLKEGERIGVMRTSEVTDCNLRQ